MKPGQKISFLQLLLAVLCGIVMAVHRRLDPSGANQGVVAIAASALLTVWSGFAYRLREKNGWTACQPDKLCFGLLAGAGMLYLVSAPGFLMYRQLSSVLRAVCGTLAGLCGLATLARLSSRDKSASAGIYSVIPVFLHSLFLLLLYRGNADNPHMSQFGYETAVFAMALLGVYGACGGRFENKHRVVHQVLCSVGLAFVTQELMTLLLQREVITRVAGMGWGALLLLPACWLLMACGLLYHREFERELVELTEAGQASEEQSAQ